MARARVPLLELLRSRFPDRAEKELYAAVLRGEVTVDGEKVLKPGVPVAPAAALALRPARPYVSRGGEKLARALDEWKIDCAGRVLLDAGCSTGGFTDCLLARGAAVVFAVDVGSNTLAWRLRTDPRVRVRERTNVMDLHPEDLAPAPHSAVADLSFRSLRRAARHILGLTLERWGIFLVKPQFEWTDPPADFRGVVQSSQDVREIVKELLDGLALEGVHATRAVASPLRGRKGNRELLVQLELGGPKRPPRQRLDLEDLLGD
ncbi:MAG: TlyA family rRNA (cytidine-2'-O)-methyltransferase [Spirochaetes bacterium]|nr:TlyA family rRNA (cytidine-2'-O)-methyltransferase [Spirochaetota bacterium]